jgi:hypothetical protein
VRPLDWEPVETPEVWQRYDSGTRALLMVISEPGGWCIHGALQGGDAYFGASLPDLLSAQAHAGSTAATLWGSAEGTWTQKEPCTQLWAEPGGFRLSVWSNRRGAWNWRCRSEHHGLTACGEAPSQEVAQERCVGAWMQLARAQKKLSKQWS